MSDITQIGGDNPFDWKDVTSADLFKGKRVVIFSLPGAFTPTCSTTHLPGYESNYEAIKACGVDEIYCLSVNDAFVMRLVHACVLAFVCGHVCARSRFLAAFCEAEACGAELGKMPREGATQKELLAILPRKSLKYVQTRYGLFVHLQIRPNPASLDVMKDISFRIQRGQKRRSKLEGIWDISGGKESNGLICRAPLRGILRASAPQDSAPQKATQKRPRRRVIDCVCSYMNRISLTACMRAASAADLL